MHRKGAYTLYLDIRHPLTIDVGMLRNSLFPAGRYIYVGSASAGIDQRIARHRRLATQKTGKIHWHIDYLLSHPDVVLTGTRSLEGGSECEISKKIASASGTSIPVPKFGSTDCVAGCEAHLYRIHNRAALRNKAKANRSVTPARITGELSRHRERTIPARRIKHG